MATTNKLMVLGSGNTGNLSFTATSASVNISASKSNSEDSIRLCPDADCYVRITNAASTAVTTDAKLIASIPESFGIPEDGIILSVVRATADGTLNYMISKGM